MPQSGWQPLEGVRVVDFSMFVPGPFASAILADLGASLRRPVPKVGEHTREILVESGFDAADIDALLKAGAVKAG